MMWRYAGGLLLSVAVIVMAASLVYAEPTEDMTFTCTGVAIICSAPTGFSITRFSDYEMQLAWTAGGGVENTIIRGAYGRYPTSTTDGFEVYEGNATSATHFINTEFISEDIYYRLWTNCGNDTLSAGYAQDTTTGGEGVIFIGLLALACAVTVGSFWWRRKETGSPFLIMLAGMAWLAPMAYELSKIDGITDATSRPAALVCMVVAFLLLAYPLWARRTHVQVDQGQFVDKSPKPDDDDIDEWFAARERKRQERRNKDL